MIKLYLFLLIPFYCYGAAENKSVMDYFRNELRSGKRTSLFVRLGKGETISIIVADRVAPYIIPTERAYEMVIEAIKELKQERVNEIAAPTKSVGMAWGYE